VGGGCVSPQTARNTDTPTEYSSNPKQFLFLVQEMFLPFYFNFFCCHTIYSILLSPPINVRSKVH
jgi:hypothetical protein